MTTHDVLEKVNLIFKDVLENDDLIINGQTTANDIEEWDSLSHIQLIVAIEKYFRIRFSSSEIGSFADVGDMCEGISKKISA